MKLGSAIKVARVRQGRTQGELAKRLGVSPTYISLLERDQRDPSWSFLEKLATELRTPLPLLLLLASPEEGASGKGAEFRSLLANELLALVVADARQKSH